jgi:hypothetical protein
MNYFEFLSYMSYIYMRKHHKEDSSGWEISFRKSSVRGSTPDGNGKIPFPLMTKGEIFIRCRAQRHGSRRSDGHRRSMSYMNFSIA